MTHWEYRVINIAALVSRWTKKAAQRELENLERQMNALGNKGWEMIEFTTIPITSGWSSSIKAYSYIAYFKRPKTP